MAEDITNTPVEKITMLTAFKNFADFDGRATRKEFGLFVLFEALLVLFMVLFKAGIIWSWSIFFTGEVSDALKGFLEVLIYAIPLVLLVPGTLVAIRRMQDMGWCKWWVLPVAVWGAVKLFLALLPVYAIWLHVILAWLNPVAVIYSLILLSMLLTGKSDPAENIYGKPRVEAAPEKDDAEADETDDAEITMLTAIMNCLSLGFKGRATRKEFFLFVLLTAAGAVLLFLLNFIGTLILFLCDPGMMDYIDPGNYFNTLWNLPVLIPMALISILWNLAILYPLACVSVRRMQDTGRNRLFALLLAPYLFLTVIGIWLPAFLFPPMAQVILLLIALGCGIAFLVLACGKSQPGKNQYDLEEEEEDDEDEENEDEENEEEDAEEDGE